MSDKTRHLTDGVRKFSPLLQAFEDGYSIEQIKEAAFEVLRPEFRNQSVLDRYGIDLLTVEAINIAKVKLDPDMYSVYVACKTLHTELMSKAPERCSEICSQWEQEIGTGLHHYWNAARFEVSKDDLSLDEFAYEAFRNIGSLLEATMQPYLRELLHLLLENINSATSKEVISSLDFGNVINRIEKLGFIPQALRPRPSNLPINQWRNIAQHFSISTDGTKITCVYGRGEKKSVIFTRTELWNALITFTSIQRAIRTAHTIFHLDHADVLATHCRGYKRKDSDLQFQFIVGAASQGFEVVELKVEPELSIALLRDVTLGEATPRGIHASQFVLGLWSATKSKTVEIHYSTKDCTPHLRARASSSDCELVANGERDMQYLAGAVELILVKPPLRIDIPSATPSN